MSECIITEKFVQNIIGKRKREIHKGDCGRILIAAGTVGMAGAAVLSARGALRAGSGLVQMAVPEEIFPIIQIGAPEATCLKRDFSKIDLRRYDAVAVGPGLGEGKESVRAVRELLKRFDGPMVLDADALNIVAAYDLFGLLRERKAGMTVITPHPGEAARLLGRGSMKEGQNQARKPERKEVIKELRRKTGAVVVLKGHETLVATEEEETYTNTTGNPGMATAGSGDVLTGIIAGLMGQRRPSGERISPAEAALCGVYLHGRAGDLAAETVGEYGLNASDIAYYTAIALKNISGRTSTLK